MPQKSLHQYTAQFQNFPSRFLQSLKKLSKQNDIEHIYFTERCFSMTMTFVTQTEITGCGYKRLHTKKSIQPYLKCQKVAVVMNIDKAEIQEVQEFQYLFPSVYIHTLQTTETSVGKALFKEWKNFKESVKKIVEVNMNFGAFLDGAYFACEKEKISSNYFQGDQAVSLKGKVSPFRSFLLGFPKIYEFELHYEESQAKSCPRLKSFIKEMQTQMQSCLKTMENHIDQCPNLDKVSSPKIKVLLLNREVLQDYMSPLMYSYLYGPLCQEVNHAKKADEQERKSSFDGNEYMTAKGKMMNSTFDRDLDETSTYIKGITDDKTVLEGPFEANYFYKAKKVIAQIKEPSPLEISTHIALWKEVMKFAETRLKTTSLQQSIANRKDESAVQLSNGDVVDLIEKWVLGAKAQEVTQQEYLKLTILAEMSDSLWFWNRMSLRSILQRQYKERYKHFQSINKKNGFTKKPLLEKQQQSQEKRQDLYRHEPSIVRVCKAWFRKVLSVQGKEEGPSKFKFQKKQINNDLSKNRQSKLVIVFDGMMGYNQLAMLQRTFKALEKEKDKSISIIAENYASAQEYCDSLTL